MGLEKIAEYKKILGLTNEELSKLSGVPKGTLDKILSGITKDPKLGTLKALAKVLGCTLNDFDDNNSISKNNLSTDEENLLEKYNSLNSLGKNKLLEYSMDLTETPKYTNDNKVTDLITATINIHSSNKVTTFAAHTDDDPDIAKHDEMIARKFIEDLKNKKNK